jgi:hypothetical protein
MKTEQPLGHIDTAAFAVENVQVTAEIAARNSQRLAADAPEREAINQLAHQLGQAGIPVAATALLATRIVKLEGEIRRLKQLPRHLHNVELRG